MNTWVIIALIIAGVVVFGIIVYAVLAAVVFKNVRKAQEKMIDEWNRF